MELLLKLTALCLTAAIAGALLRRSGGEWALLPALGAVAVCGALLLAAAEELSELLDELLSLTRLAPALFAPLWKVAAISIVVRIASALCRDAGQGALAAALETGGAVCALLCAVPLVRAFLDMLEGWL